MARPKDGSKIYPTDAESAEFESQIVKNAGPTGECWIMERPLRGRYPYFIFRGEIMLANRFAYRAALDKLPIPPERPMLRRVCRIKTCVNPDHQSPVNDFRNAELGFSPIGANMRKEACPKCLGPYLRDKDGKRRCPECRTQLQREWGERQKVPCKECGEPSTSGECRRCLYARVYSVNRENRAAKRAIRSARRALREAMQKFCEKHGVAKTKKPKGWVCPECSRDTRKRTGRRKPDFYRNLRAEGRCVSCKNLSETYRCPPCHARHMASTHARRARQSAERIQPRLLETGES